MKENVQAVREAIYSAYMKEAQKHEPGSPLWVQNIWMADTMKTGRSIVLPVNPVYEFSYV
tara:strand:- start:1474 stop:1653 length:180 start_codon:yes stop_codon:yes gene_type:complete